MANLTKNEVRAKTMLNFAETLDKNVRNFLFYMHDLDQVGRAADGQGDARRQDNQIAFADDARIHGSVHGMLKQDVGDALLSDQHRRYAQLRLSWR